MERTILSVCIKHTRLFYSHRLNDPTSVTHTYIYFVATFVRERFERQILYLKNHEITRKSFADLTAIINKKCNLSNIVLLLTLLNAEINNIYLNLKIQ
jgi:hypothetical protein